MDGLLVAVRAGISSWTLLGLCDRFKRRRAHQSVGAAHLLLPQNPPSGSVLFWETGMGTPRVQDSKYRAVRYAQQDFVDKDFVQVEFETGDAKMAGLSFLISR